MPAIEAPAGTAPTAGAAKTCPCCDEAVTVGASSKLDVFVVGGVGIDTVVRVPSLPPEDRDSFLVPPVETGIAHTGHGVVMGCHALGLRTALADVIGDDDEGRRIVAAYEAAGVDLRYVTHPSGTRRAVNLVAPDGRRMSFYDPRHPAEMLPDGRLWALGSAARAARARLDHGVGPPRTGRRRRQGSDDEHRPARLGRREPAPPGVRARRGHRVPVRIGVGRPRGRRARDDPGRLVAPGSSSPRTAKRGSRVAVRGRPPEHVPAATIPGRPVVDSNGAGDSYVAAFLRSVLAGPTCASPTGTPRAARERSLAPGPVARPAPTHRSSIPGPWTLSF